MLQFVVSGDDFAGRFANEFACFVHVARMLRDLECESIRLKLHPSRLMAPYYERIAQFFKIECDFFNDGPADEHIEWSDFVIGPIHTAAMLEAMAQGKPYFPLHLSPSTVDPRSVKGCRIYRDFDSLRQALRAEFLQDQSATINYYTGADENRDAVERVWKTLYGLASAKQNGPRSSGH
jgi:hypothetical protein